MGPPRPHPVAVGRQVTEGVFGGPCGPPGDEFAPATDTAERDTPMFPSAHGLTPPPPPPTRPHQYTSE